MAFSAGPARRPSPTLGCVSRLAAEVSLDTVALSLSSISSSSFLDSPGPLDLAPELQQRLLDHLCCFARPRHSHWDPLGLLAVRAELQALLAPLGSVEDHPFRIGSEAGRNLILRLPGRQNHLPPLLVGAHYDGPLQSPGADDNATGLAALVELARHWALQPPRRPVWLVAFDQEETGLLGSCALAADLKARGQRLGLMVSLEMLGYTSPQQRYPLAAMRHLYGERGDFLALVANLRALAHLPGMARRLGRHVPTRVLPVPGAGRLLPEVRRSDHSPFWDQGYAAVLATDTSFLRNPHYHQASDTIDSLDLPFLTAVTTGLARALSAL